MAALRCSRCGALIQLDGTTSCSCVLPAVDDLNATYDAFRPHRKAASFRQAEVGAPEPTPAETGETGRPRMGGHRMVVVGVVAAVTLGTAALALYAMSSGQEDGYRPPLSAWALDEIPPDWLEGLDGPSPGGPHDGGPSESAEGGTSHEGGHESEGSGKHDGSPAPEPEPDDEGSSPPSSGDGDADGGPTGDPGGNADGSTDAGGTQGSGGSDDGGGLDKPGGGQFGGRLGDGDHDQGRGHHNGGNHHGGGDGGGGHGR